MHAPITDFFVNDSGAAPYSTATRDAAARQRDDRRNRRRRCTIAHGDPVRVPRGSPRACRVRRKPGADDNSRDAAIRSIEEHACDGGAARRTGGARGDGQRSVDGCRRWLNCSSEASTARDLGICMDVGHAHLLGDVGRSHRDGVGVSRDHTYSRQPRDRRRPSRALPGQHRLGGHRSWRWRRSATMEC